MEHQSLFKPGVRVRASTGRRLETGFLFAWTPGDTHFEIVNPKTGQIIKLDYFKCKWVEVWPQTTKRIKLFKKMITDLESGKLSLTMTPEHIAKLKEIII